MSAWDDASTDEPVERPDPTRVVRDGMPTDRDGFREFAAQAPTVQGVSPFPHVPVKPNGGEPELIDTSLLINLHKWMADHHASLQRMTGEKAVEYGSLDLSIMGASIAKLWPGIGENAPPGSQLQAAIAFYLLGKVSRVLSALAEGKPPPTDSWEDAEVYAMMGRYVQEHGQWP